MDPATLAIAGLVGSVASAGVGAFGAMQNASAQADAARYNAAVARNNQIIADQNAARSAQAGRVRAQNQDYANAAKMGMITAAEGASGVDTGSPTSKEVRDAAMRLGRLDTETILDNAMQTSRSESAQAMNFGAQSGLDLMTASNAQSAGFLSAASSIVGGASSFSDKWLRYQSIGAV